MKQLIAVLERLLNAVAFANAGNFREFEELLEARDRRLIREQRSTARHPGAAARRTRRKSPARAAVGAYAMNEAVPG